MSKDKEEEVKDFREEEILLDEEKALLQIRIRIRRLVRMTIGIIINDGNSYRRGGYGGF